MDGEIKYPISDSDSEDKEPLEEGVYRVNGVLAAFMSGKNKSILVDWEGHRVPTWHLDEGVIKHNLTCANLKPDLSADSEEFQKACGVDKYVSFAGHLETLVGGDNAVGFENRLYIDASEKGNVSCPILVGLTCRQLE